MICKLIEAVRIKRTGAVNIEFVSYCISHVECVFTVFFRQFAGRLVPCHKVFAEQRLAQILLNADAVKFIGQIFLTV